jgi:YhcH/YjgK/YiaL family protein
MIYDQIKYLSKLPLPGTVCDKIIAFMGKAPDLPAGKYEIDGKRIYASIFCYTTVAAKEGVFEAHQQYADLQLLLHGEEQVGVIQSDKLQAQTPYDAAGDAILYEPRTAEYSKVILYPGYFALLLPRDIHMPGLATKIPGPVTKVVIKIAVDLFAFR